MKKLMLYIAPILLLAACAKDLTEYNRDQKNPAEVTQAPLFSNALKEMTDNITSPSVNINVFRFWVQQWTATTYQDEPRYNFVTRNIPQNFWDPFYREALHDLQVSKRLAEADSIISDQVKNNQIAATEIAAVLIWATLVNTWGDIPYTEALNIEQFIRPQYDDAEAIYSDLFARLDTAIALIDVNEAGFGAADLIYAGDMNSWNKFAHSLKLRLAITIADVDAAKAQQIITESAPLAFSSNADNATFQYQTAMPNNNPVSTALNPSFTSRLDYVAGKPFVDLLNRLSDPRRPQFFTTINGAYIGGIIGINNKFENTSSASEKVIAPNLEALLLDYAEVEFILAEASERWGILGSAAEHYRKAIQASISYWGGSSSEITTYLNRPDVAYATASGDWKQKIGTQKWIALYNRAVESWTEWRRLDHPILIPADGAVNPGIIPNRLPYPRSEYDLNESNLNSAINKLGADDVVQKIFWDVN